MVIVHERAGALNSDDRSRLDLIGYPAHNFLEQSISMDCVDTATGNVVLLLATFSRIFLEPVLWMARAVRLEVIILTSH